MCLKFIKIIAWHFFSRVFWECSKNLFLNAFIKKRMKKVGGDFYHNIVLNHMKDFGRILVCGSIQTYNDTEVKKYAATNSAILM